MSFISVFLIFLELQGLEGGPPKTCPDGKYFPDPDECRVFYQCDRGRPVRKFCGPGTVFNPKSWVCDWPYNVDCGASHETSTKSPNQCKDGFDYPDPVTCPSKVFYQCIGKEKIQQTCKHWLVFNPKKCKCDKPTNIKCQDAPSKCERKIVPTPTTPGILWSTTFDPKDYEEPSTPSPSEEPEDYDDDEYYEDE
ncbi:peritrophin-1-like [Macrosteles quadrilineatus]|uniref:peritrophin-1-like n=1 Tax=Macrosteles quadrilineatus TaxID=74068 RepID=UPI0023E2AA11|nr:peritrophin-1-like [Macrosteles quadrilineatus]